MGAVPMLQSLTKSKHKTIATCSEGALNNLNKSAQQRNPKPKPERRSSLLEARRKTTPEVQESKLGETGDDQLSDNSDEVNRDVRSDATHDRQHRNLPEQFASTPYLPGSRPSLELTAGKNPSFVKQPGQQYGPASYGGYFGAGAYEESQQRERVMSPSKLEALRTSYQSNQGEEDEELLLEEDDESPTDYGAKFGDPEEDDDEGEEEHVNVENGGMKDEPVVDTVRTYCTEGTPYDTPYVVSGAPSVSDLREVGRQMQTSALIEEAEVDMMEASAHDRSCGSSLDTPISDQPRAYCTEDTPGLRSRDDSDRGHDQEEEEVILQNDKEPSEKSPTSAKLSNAIAESAPGSSTPAAAPAPAARSVKFNAQETPLIYSRTSSFESLNSFDQQSCRTGYSSCDFSRMPSGRVSPSDLPDSPGENEIRSCMTRESEK